MEKTVQKSKETDITPFLVGVFVLLVGILIARASLDFTKTKTNTSSRASDTQAALAQSKNDETCRSNKPFGDIQHDTSKDYCRTIGTTCRTHVVGGNRVDSGYVRDMRSEKTSRCGITRSDCCRSATQTRTYKDFYGKPVTEVESIEKRLGDLRCVRETKHSEATCIAADTTHPNKAFTKAGVSCAVLRKNHTVNSMLTRDDVIMDGECWFDALAPTTTPPDTSTNGKRVDSCGPEFYNCEATWKQGRINTNNAGNKSKDGSTLEPVCIAMGNMNDINSYKCGMAVPMSQTTCDGGQWATPLQRNFGVDNRCFMTEKGAPTEGTNGTAFKVCVFKPTEQIPSIGKNLKITECKNQAAANLK